MGAALVGGVGLAGLGVSGSVGLPRDIPPEQGVPNLGQAYVGAIGQEEERPPTMVVTVHGLRRIEGAAILYYSVGFEGEAPDPSRLPVTVYGTGPDSYSTLQSSTGATFMDTAAAIDVAGKRSYAALRTSGGQAVAAAAPTSPDDRLRLSDRAVVQWIALAPIPKKVSRVDVLIGSAFVRDIPVGNGLLEPVVDDPMPASGSGWPRVDTLAVAGARPDATVKKLVLHVSKVKPRLQPSPPATPTPTASPSPSPSGSG